MLEVGLVTRFAAWVLAASLFAVAAERTAAQDKPASSDASITRRVESALASASVLAKMHIKVETRDGVVTLSGFVRSLENIAKAGGVAQGIPGVSAVRNDLRVADRPSRA